MGSDVLLWIVRYNVIVFCKLFRYLCWYVGVDRQDRIGLLRI